jgi:putative inorganic carbon (HCO3(-)) transporter
MTTTRHNQADSWIFYGLLVLMAWLPIPYGSNRPWAAALLGLMAATLLVLWLCVALAGRVKLQSSVSENRWMILLWLLWLGWIAFQLLPLPFSIVQILSPQAATHYLDGFPGAATESWSLSIAPGRTYQQLLLSLSYFVLYLLVVQVASSRERLSLLAGVIVLSGLAQALYGSLMVLSGIEYGFLMKKVAYLGNATGTFINRNHLAGYLEITAAVGIGLVVADLRGRMGGNWRIWLRDLSELIFSRKLRVRVFVSVMVIALVLTRSRMGNTAFFASLLLCGAIYVLLRERHLFVKSVLLFASLLLIDLLIVSNWYGLEKVVERVEQTEVATEARAHIAPELVRAADAYWLTGAGLGNFATAFLPFRVSHTKHYYDHAHNDYAEFMVETGIIGCALLTALVLATVLHALRVMVSRRDRLRTGIALAGFMAMTAIAIHSTVDFNLQIPANAATLVVIMAMVNSSSHRSKALRRHKAHVLEQEGDTDSLAGASA